MSKVQHVAWLLSINLVCSCKGCTETSTTSVPAVHNDAAQPSNSVAVEAANAPPPEPVSAVLARATRAIDLLKMPQRVAQPIIPAAALSTVACEVDDNMRMHVLQLSPPTDHDKAQTSKVLRYALVDLNHEYPPTWHAIATVYDGSSPTLTLHGDAVVGGVLGRMTPTTNDGSSYPTSFLLWPSLTTPASSPQVCIMAANSSVRMAMLSAQKIVALTRNYVPPHWDLSYLGLRTKFCNSNNILMGEQQIPGVMNSGVPSDYDVYIAKDGEIHVVYEGIRHADTDSHMRLWDLVLDSSASLIAETALAAGVEFPYLTRIFRGPNGQLHVLEVYGVSSTTSVSPSVLAHRIIRLDGMADRPGPPLHLFIDPWLQLHAVWFHDNEARYFGPSSLGR